MISLLHHTAIDKQKWDACIHHSRHRRIYALSWYLDAVCKNWYALVEDDYRSVMPLTARKKFGVHYLYQPHFAQQLGVFSEENIGSEKIYQFLSAIPEKFRFAEININTGNTLAIVEKKVTGFTTRKNANFELIINDSYAGIFSSFSENTKRNIRKAVKNNISVTWNEITVGEVIGLFRNNKGKEFRELGKEYYRLFKNLSVVLHKKNCLITYGAYHRDKSLCAGAVFIIYGGTATFIFSAANASARSTGAMFYLIDRFIYNNAEKLSILDFEGSNNENLARFYKSFGAKEYVYLQLRRNNLPGIVRWLKNK